MLRIYIGNLAETVTEIHLRELFERLVPVKEVYIPKIDEYGTGLFRGFDIVLVEENSSSFDKNIKLLNNCFWKGSKIRVEKAKEFYLDRLKREKEIEKSVESKRFEYGKEDEAVIRTESISLAKGIKRINRHLHFQDSDESVGNEQGA